MNIIETKTDMLETKKDIKDYVMSEIGAVSLADRFDFLCDDIDMVDICIQIDSKFENDNLWVAGENENKSSSDFRFVEDFIDWVCKIVFP